MREAKQLSQGDIEEQAGLLRCYISRVERQSVPRGGSLTMPLLSISAPARMGAGTPARVSDDPSDISHVCGHASRSAWICLGQILSGLVPHPRSPVNCSGYRAGGRLVKRNQEFLGVDVIGILFHTFDQV